MKTNQTIIKMFKYFKCYLQNLLEESEKDEQERWMKKLRMEIASFTMHLTHKILTSMCPLNHKR